MSNDAPVNEERKRLIQITLTGPDLERFDRYKEREFIRPDAAAGRKLMLERLAQLETQELEGVA